MDKSTKRLSNEFKLLQKNPIGNCIVTLPDQSNLHKWEVHMSGPEGSPYEEGVFLISFEFPENYPFKYPEVKFVTPMYHPNIKKTTGEICMDVFASSWTPTQKVADIIQKLISLLKSPSISSPLEAEIAQEYSSNYDKFCKSVKKWIKSNSS